jgi:hypothetical protein
LSPSALARSSDSASVRSYTKAILTRRLSYPDLNPNLVGWNKLTSNLAIRCSDAALRTDRPYAPAEVLGYGHVFRPKAVRPLAPLACVEGSSKRIGCCDRQFAGESVRKICTDMADQIVVGRNVANPPEPRWRERCRRRPAAADISRRQHSVGRGEVCISRWWLTNRNTCRLDSSTSRHEVTGCKHRRFLPPHDHPN